MLSSLTVVIAVALASSLSKMALAQCACYPYYGNNAMFCNDTSLTSIPDCVAIDITWLLIATPSIPLVADTISRFTNLHGVDITEFDYPQITKTFLSGQPNMTSFAIHDTSLDYVDGDWFQYAPRIRTLLLDHNKISSLAADTFSSLPYLETLSLLNNALTTLPPSLFQGTGLVLVNVSNNPWHCDCELATFMQWTRDNEVLVIPGGYCLHPVELEGLDLNYLTPDLACTK